MKRLLMAVLLLLPLVAFAGGQQVIDLPVFGMTCKFCAYGVQLSLSKVPGVEQCDVSAKEGLVRIVLVPGAKVDIETLKAKVLESGFSPGKATVRSTSQ